LLLREVSCSTLGNLRLLIVYAKQAFIQHTCAITKNSTPNKCNRENTVSHPVLEGKPNANHVCARIRTHVHNAYIVGHHHTMLEINSGKVL
jgi:hypothetical protein